MKRNNDSWKKKKNNGDLVWRGHPEPHPETLHRKGWNYSPSWEAHSQRLSVPVHPADWMGLEGSLWNSRWGTFCDRVKLNMWNFWTCWGRTKYVERKELRWFKKKQGIGRIAEGIERTRNLKINDWTPHLNTVSCLILTNTGFSDLLWGCALCSEWVCVKTSELQDGLVTSRIQGLNTISQRGTAKLQGLYGWVPATGGKGGSFEGHYWLSTGWSL